MAKDELFSGESKNIEYKVVVPDKSEKYMKTVVAFANTQGGRLVIGIDDKTHQVVGVDNDSLFQAMDALTNAISCLLYTSWTVYDNKCVCGCCVL